MPCHPSHKTRMSMDASTFDEICINCGATDQVPGGWGQLAEPCPCPGTGSKPARDGQAAERLAKAAPQMLAALKAARAFGSQGDTHEGVSVSWMIDKAIKAAEGGGQ